MKTFANLDDFAAAKGTELGPTDWTLVDQDRVNLFADATDDHQWIHVEPDRAAQGPFGGTIAHGLLTLSLLPRFMHQLYGVDNVTMAVGKRIRAAATITDVTSLEGAVQATLTTTVEIEGAGKPAAVIESIVRYVR
jgi:acyl dehydratase